MTKIGIMTFHRAINYGALLQAYALQECIQKLGHDPLIIDYKNPYFEKAYDPKNINYRNLRSFLIGILKYNGKKRKKNSFEEFISKYLKLDPIQDLYSLENVDHLNSFSNFIVGSDQVWNFVHTQFDKAYFLDFVSDPRKKNSYAPSFGFDKIPDDYIDEYKELLFDFNNISVREDQGAVIIEHLLNRQAEVVIDPTLLLTRDEWDKICKTSEKYQNYILIYQLSYSKSIDNFASYLSKQTGCKIINISEQLQRRIKADYKFGVSPQEFLGLIKNAKYIITNSFHGTVFSIIFNKKFFLELMPSKYNVNSRFVNLLNTYDLECRKIVDGINNNINSEINYLEINKKIELKKQHSQNYLKRILEGE